MTPKEQVLAAYPQAICTTYERTYRPIHGMTDGQPTVKGFAIWDTTRRGYLLGSSCHSEDSAWADAARAITPETN